MGLKDLRSALTIIVLPDIISFASYLRSLQYFVDSVACRLELCLLNSHSLRARGNGFIVMVEGTVG